jgi:hypothetical protein
MKGKILVAGAGGFIGGHLVSGWEPDTPLRIGMEKTTPGFTMT